MQASTTRQSTPCESALPLADCAHCPLSPDERVLSRGPVSARLVLVGEAPGREEVKRGAPFVGSAGRLLSEALRSVGLSDEDVYITNAALCRAPYTDDKKEIVTEAASRCKRRLIAEIDALPQAEVVVALGNVAITALAEERTTLIEVLGEARRDERGRIWLCTIHPAAIVRGMLDDAEEFLWTLERAARLLRGEERIDEAEDFSYSVISDAEEAKRLFEGLAGSKWSLDVETTGIDPRENSLLLLAVSDGERAWVVLPEALDDAAKEALKHAMRTSTLVFHSAGFDLQWIWWTLGEQVKPARIEDTIALAGSLTSRAVATSLKFLAKRWLGVPEWEREVKKYAGRRSKVEGFRHVPLEILAPYAAKDPYYTMRLEKPLEAECRRKGVYEFSRILNRFCATAAYWTWWGVCIDMDKVAELDDDLTRRMGEQERKIREIASEVGYANAENLNLRSHRQLKDFFFGTLRLPQKRGTSLNKAALDELAPLHPAAAHLLEFRRLDKLRSAYVRGIQKHIRPDGRVHPHFFIAGATATGRIVIRDPPIQTAPREVMGAPVRQIFAATPGYKMIVGDFSQLELRLACHLSGDEALRQTLSAEDPHAETARKIFGKPPGAPLDDAEREAGKRMNFRALYGGSMAGSVSLEGSRAQYMLAGRGLDYDGNVAVDLAKKFWETYSTLRDWREKLVEEAMERGWLQNELGRKKWWYVVTKAEYSHVERQIANFPTQSLASDFCLWVACDFTDELMRRKWGCVQFTVHDCIVAEVREDVAEEAAELLKELAANPPFRCTVELPLKVEVADCWH